MKKDVKKTIHEKTYVIFGLLILTSLAISLVSWQESSQNIISLNQEIANKNKVESQYKIAVNKMSRNIEELNETIANDCP